MRYLGGKHVAGRHIVPFLVRHNADVVWDACCGGLSIGKRLGDSGQAVLCSDVHPSLMAMYKAVASGWRPPTSMTEEDYKRCKALADGDPLKGFAGFGCAFGGIWFCGFAKDNTGRNYAAESSRSVIAGVVSVQSSGGAFAHLDFLRCAPHDIGNTVLYLDPPYRGTASYSGVAPFDFGLFDRLVCEWAKIIPVYVSEYDLPYGRCVWEKQQKSTVARDKSVRMRTEKLYRVGSVENATGRMTTRRLLASIRKHTRR